MLKMRPQPGGLVPAPQRDRRAHGIPAQAAPPRHHGSGGVAGDGRGAARALRRRGIRRQSLCRPGAADRLRADHQPALCRRLHDRAAWRCARTTACSRSAPARAIRRPCCRGWRARWSSLERYRTLAERRAGAACRARLRQCRGRGRRRLGRRAGAARHSTASCVTAAAERCRRRWSISSPTTASWCCRLARHQRTATHCQAYQVANGPRARRPDPGAFRAARRRRSAGTVSVPVRGL